MTVDRAGGRGGGRDDVVWHLRLYVAGQSPKSLHAFANLKRLCDEHLAGRFEIEVVDLVGAPRASPVRRHRRHPDAHPLRPGAAPQDHRGPLGHRAGPRRARASGPAGRDVADHRPTTLDDALAQLDEAQDTLRAIGAGEVDAFVVADGGRTPSVFGLSTRRPALSDLRREHAATARRPSRPEGSSSTRTTGWRSSSSVPEGDDRRHTARAFWPATSPRTGNGSTMATGRERPVELDLVGASGRRSRCWSDRRRSRSTASASRASPSPTSVPSARKRPRSGSRPCCSTRRAGDHRGRHRWRRPVLEQARRADVRLDGRRGSSAARARPAPAVAGDRRTERRCPPMARGSETWRSDHLGDAARRHALPGLRHESRRCSTTTVGSSR